MIDTHSHLDGPEFAEDLDETIQRAKDKGVKCIFIPGICLKDMSRVFELCKQYEGYLYPMIGLHPENIMDEDYNHALDEMENILKEKLTDNSCTTKPIAIGEVGIDLYWEDNHKAEQLDAFERQITWAEKYDLPLMIHSRNAHKELMTVMERHRQSNLKGVFHCFNGTVEEAEELLSFPGFMLGIGGVCTFKKSTLPEVLKKCVPLDRIVLETDSPYLAPVPKRGKRNESSFITYTMDKLSQIYNTEKNFFMQQTEENVVKVFSKCSFFKKK